MTIVQFGKKPDIPEGAYLSATEGMPVDEKMKILEELGRGDLVNVFKDWKPRPQRSKALSAPLDQRITIATTTDERYFLTDEIETVKKLGSPISMAQYIRNKAMGTVDLEEWDEIAHEALAEIEEIKAKEKDLKKERRDLVRALGREDVINSEEEVVYERRIEEIDGVLDKIHSKSVKRDQRLSGRLTMVEAEQVKWRAQRLCLSTSEYLRFLIFDQKPNTEADVHMNLDAKRRFYISIIDVARNGWGTPPNVYECKQCRHYQEELDRAQEENRQLRAFVR